MRRTRPVLLLLASLVLVGWFSREISDPDFWWHLKTGEYVVHNLRLPVPDPFAYTTYMGQPAYAGEDKTRYFNLTHEWLAQAILYGVWAGTGFAGVVLFRALLLAVLPAIVGVIVWRRCGGFYRALGAALAAGASVAPFAYDRPYMFTFAFLAATMLILESRRGLWLLPLLMVVWANCHGGYFLGLVAMGAYSAEAFWIRRKKGAQPEDRVLWLASAAAAAATGLNPNGYRIFEILGYYRGSALTSRLLEWKPTVLWPVTWPVLMIAAGALVLLWKRRQARLSDWLLFAAFAAAALNAQRNAFLVGAIAPVVIASYVPVWKRAVPRAAVLIPVLLLSGWLVWSTVAGPFFRLRVDEWRWPSGAASFLLEHRITGRIFNTYEYGGYLIWRLWPEQRVFIDGRALNESVFNDYGRILYNRPHDADGDSAQELLRKYDVQAIVMNTFEYTGGLTYLLAPSLADPQQAEWKLVYDDPQAMVFLRNPPPGMDVLPPSRVLDHMEAECRLHIGRQPEYTLCARAVSQVLLRAGERQRARRWLGTYLERPHYPDPEAEDAYRKLILSGN